ncbi:unnamed protein product [Kuraishia capsulata CBS 1993]|uniref:Uncharacterized protein n=1 Tax=Kuraishia capsulata CBS 1993 TaxID=1382522 RepID=W6MW46_9ASCO|nr:uncharacterized protein KUCA_T00002854001 [Kuraishia capsulata CBS 1993]CDK26880.1 unnamed protein product [Kuraishia capsulata CBS 1993]
MREAVAKPCPSLPPASNLSNAGKTVLQIFTKHPQKLITSNSRHRITYAIVPIFDPKQRGLAIVCWRTQNAPLNQTIEQLNGAVRLCNCRPKEINIIKEISAQF